MFPFFSAMMLAVESNAVVGLRLTKLAGGGMAACDEALLMVREKVDAAFEAGSMLAAGSHAEDVVARYREHVAANAIRLT